MSAEKLLAYRLFRSKKHPKRPSRTAVISIGGIAAGVASLVIVLSIMGGFERTYQNQLLAIQPHSVLQIWNSTSEQRTSLEDKLNQFKDRGELQWSETLENPAMIFSDGEGASVTALGISQEGWDRLSKKISYGDSPRWKNEVVLGWKLANSMSLDVGDSLDIINPFEQESLIFPVPLTLRVRVVGIIQTQLAEWDYKGIWMNLETLKTFFGMAEGRRTYGIYVSNPFAIERVQKEVKTSVSAIQPALESSLKSWKEIHTTIYHSMRLEQRAMFVILLLIITVAAFNIASLLTMATHEKRSQIGMLLTMGMTPPRIATIFSRHGLTLGLWGIGLGLGLGLGVVLFLKYVPVIKIPDVYYDQTLPVRIPLGWIILVLLSTLVITKIAALIPAKKASQLAPLECLRRSR